MTTKRLLWLSSYAVTTICAGLLAYHLISLHHSYDPDETQLTDEPSISRYLDEYYNNSRALSNENVIKIPTGIFVSTVTWIDAHSFQISGIIWQKYEHSLRGKIEEGFILPEAIEIDKREVYRFKSAGAETVGWYFEGKINQRFDYAKYPLDHKIVKIRLWHQSFAQPIILTPDFSSFESTKSVDKFGLDPEIAMGGYDILETFFRYHHPRYDTNFGKIDHAKAQGFPELYYNIVLRRHAMDALIVYVLPLIVVFILCFCTLLSITLDDKKREVYNSSYLEILNECAALFFVVLLAHIHLREAFSGVGVVYIEYMYVITYLCVIYVTINAFLVLHSEISKNIFSSLVTYHDNLLAKLLFLPLFSSLALWVGLTCFS